MRIRSVNVAKPTLVEYHGETVMTGINKIASGNPLAVHGLGIEGDGQADLEVHGGVDKAVYAFPGEHYSWYQDRLQQDTYLPGQFGENLTTEGLIEANVRIGDRYRAGGALFEVSQPRSPCYKFAIKMNTVEALKVMIESGKTGFYLRVLEEGVIEAGAQFELEFSDPSAPSVEEVHRLYYLDKKNIDGLKRAVQCESLARDYRDSFEQRLQDLDLRDVDEYDGEEEDDR